MTALLKVNRSPLFAFLLEELAPRDGRGLAVARIAAACTITVGVAMLFRIPLAAYMAYLVFLTSKEDTSATLTTAVGGALAITLAVLFTLGLAQFSLGDPAIRLPAMALITFLAMFSVRTFALGPVSFLAGFITVTVQSVVDDVPNLEFFTRLSLWLWVVVLVPVVITILINLLFGTLASTVAEQRVRKVLVDLEAALTRGQICEQLGQWRRVLVPLVAKSRNPEAVKRLLDVLTILEAYPDSIAPRERIRLAGLLHGCLTALDRGKLAVSVPSAAPGEIQTSPQALAASAAIDALRLVLTGNAGPQSAAKQYSARQLFVPDALSNPAHWQFALKTTLAIMIVYSVYTLLDWPGLRTSIVTCFFVALGSLGETVHKLTLRLSGAIIGGLLAGLSIVFLLPSFTDIGQLCALTAAFALLAGWVATASERLSYAGLQMAFAFFLGVLQTYAPATDLTVLRDRVVGIILGNVVMTLVFSSLWPESSIAGLRTALADSLRGIAALLKSPEDAATHRQQTVEALYKADNFATLSLFEGRLLPREPHLLDLRSIERLAGAAFVVASEPLLTHIDSDAAASLGDWVNRAALASAAGDALPALAEGATAYRSGSAAQAALVNLRFAAAQLPTSTP